tara:strand:+ start:7698 stop:9071 length:1374 start_codon:yes stop_codon:yes gene_type:complete
MKPLTSQQKRMKELMGFTYEDNSHDVLAEQNIKEQKNGQLDQEGRDWVPPTIPFWGRKRKGDLLFNGIEQSKMSKIPKFARFRNRKFVSGDTLSRRSILYISLASKAPRLLGGGTPPPTPPPPKEKTVSLELTLDISDPFIFDKTELTDVGNINFRKFVSEWNKNKETYGPQWGEYIEFLKKNSPIILNGYASRDNDPNVSITGKFSGCKDEDGILRGDYNRCLSQARADKMVKLLSDEIPELKGLLKGVGNGETTLFADAGWTNTSSPTHEETAPNRRFQIKFPKWEKTIKDTIPNNDVTPTPDNEEEDKKSYETYLDWSKYVDGQIEGYEPGIIPATKKDGNIVVKEKHLIQIDPNLKIGLRKGGTMNGSSNGKGEISSGGMIIKCPQGSPLIFKGWTNTTSNQENNYRVMESGSRPFITGNSGTGEYVIRDIWVTLNIDPNQQRVADIQQDMFK